MTLDGRTLDLLVRLSDLVPEAIDRDWREYAPLPRGTPEPLVPRCLLATRVGLEVLSYFKIHAEPVPCEVVVGNPAFVEHFDALASNTLSDEEAVALGMHYIQIDTKSVKSNGWPGHMVVGLPQFDTLIDLDFGQFSRPQHNMIVPRAAVFRVSPEFWTDYEPESYLIAGGCRAIYQRLQNPKRWSGAGDWRKYHHRIAGPIIRQLKEEIA